ncbi:hypothetical protein RIR_jg14981.t1 [Rhizophagus irregularis DAOM 181602=DAOM 197198]|uniref:Uncharacterized protein n=1 Tax=Rhizophagus irregularis (strain DAOM 181602 / DAOM 197198 / MUCL 43194) TaxID=747089 RepID=U9STQ1_RHIID|nr:hypothetical protein RIR_jg14981.t1 [Rhizophagus irregularis DAOM 181602=DAOM 197198]
MASTADHDMGQNSTNSKESMHKPKKAEENLEHTIQNLESGQISFIKLNKVVIVNNEMMEEYHAQDGIDQGEAWSPLSSYSAENAEKK